MTLPMPTRCVSFRWTPRRLLWCVLIPVARWLPGRWSYWRNIAVSATGRGFDELWHHEHFGDRIDHLPNWVNLAGIRYKTSVAEGLVQFIGDGGLGGQRIQFRRDPHDPHAYLWYVQSLEVPASHVDQAYRWIKAVYGGSHQRKKPAKAESIAA